jgi:hypothetical protein
MTKAVEVKVGREEARKTIVDIVRENDKIRQEYILALNDFDTPLKPIEDSYDVQLHRLLSIAKEDISLAREMGRLDVLSSMQGSMQATMTEYFEKRATKENIKQLEERLPTIMSLEKNALLDFFMASDASANSTFAYRGPVFIARPTYPAISNMVFPACVANNVGLNNAIFSFDYKKKLFIPDSARRDSVDVGYYVQAFIDQYMVRNAQGCLFMLTSLMEKGKEEWLANAPLVKEIPGMFMSDANNINSKKIDGGVYKINAKTRVKDSPPRVSGIELINPAKLSIFQQFIPPERVDEFVKAHMMCDGYAQQSERLAHLLSFYNKNSLDFKIGGFTLTLKKDD